MIIDDLYNKARARQARVVLPERDDARMQAAAYRIEELGLAHVVYVPKTDPSPSEIDVILALRPKATEGTARRMLERPLFRAGACVATGAADVLLAGAASPTRRVIEAASMTIGLSAEVALPSSFFLMLLPDGRALVFADCALNVSPDAEQLAQIAVASARSADALLGHARIAMLSYSTLTSGSGESVDLVADATERVRAAGLDVIGPAQADAALNPIISQAKGLSGEVANTLIFPTLDAGNIAYKLIQELGRAQAIGPVLQGFRKPVCDLSRGASVDDIVTSLAVALALADGSAAAAS